MRSCTLFWDHSKFETLFSFASAKMCVVVETPNSNQEKKARILTARMNRAGIQSLEDLKAKLDAHGEAKMKSLGKTEKEALTVEDVLTFLEPWKTEEKIWEYIYIYLK